MTENMKKLLEAASKDEQLREKLTAAPTVEEVIAIVKEHGIELTEEDMKKPEAEELTDNALEQAAGGGDTKCVCVVGGGGDSGIYESYACGCMVYGQGDALDGKTYCVCPALGQGGDYEEIEYIKPSVSKPKRYYSD